MIHELTPRQTGFPVQAVNLEHPEADRRKPKGDDNKCVICKRHKKMVTAPKRREAHTLSRDPAEWCTRCEPKDAE